MDALAPSTGSPDDNGQPSTRSLVKAAESFGPLKLGPEQRARRRLAVVIGRAGAGCERIHDQFSLSPAGRSC
ncbi:MAG: hypothetical protein AAFY46_16440, partial [Planctomycetota bacterium]